MSLGFPAWRSSIDDIDDSEVDDAECTGVSLGDPAAVDGEESAGVEMTVLRRRDLAGLAVEAMVCDKVVVNWQKSRANCDLKFRNRII